MVDSRFKGLVRVFPSIRTMHTNYVAQSCFIEWGGELYAVRLASNALLSVVGDKPLRDFYGDKYSEKMRLLAEIDLKISKVVGFYKALDDKTFKAEDVGNIFYQKYLKALSFLGCCNFLVFEVYNVLLNVSDVRELGIGSQALSSAMQKYKRVREEGRKRLSYQEELARRERMERGIF